MLAESGMHVLKPDQVPRYVIIKFYWHRIKTVRWLQGEFWEVLRIFSPCGNMLRKQYKAQQTI